MTQTVPFTIYTHKEKCMSSQFYIYFSNTEDRSASEEKIKGCFDSAAMPGRLSMEHSSEDEFSGEDSWAEMIEEEFGIHPDWELRFTPDKDDIHESNLYLVKAVKCLLQSIDGDLLLISGSDLPMLKRIKGELTIDNEESAWDEAMLGLLNSN